MIWQLYKVPAPIFLACVAAGVAALSPKLVAAQTNPPAYHQVVIPFELRANGNIIVHATVGDKDVVCLVDTGTSEIVWPKSLNLGGAPATVQTPDGKSGPLQFHTRTTSGAVINGEGIILPLIKIGNLTLQDMVTDCVDKADPGAPQQMILGTRAFAQGSLTIDYEKKELIVRTAGYHLASPQQGSFDELFHFQWFDGTPLGMGRPAIECAIDEHPILMVIDTGASGMSIPARFYHTYLSDKPLYQGSVQELGQSAKAMKTVQGLNLAIGVARFMDQKAGLVDAPLPGGFIGYEQLRPWRITIDYPDKEVLLQPTDLEGISARGSRRR